MKKYLGLVAMLITFVVGIGRVSASQTTLFEDIGHYGFATAGNNNAYKGDSYGDRNTIRWITAADSNQAIASTSWYRNIKNRYNITNISGSKLDTSKSKIKKIYLGYYAYKSTCGVIKNADGTISYKGNWQDGSCDFTGKILLIKPDGTSVELSPKANAFRGFIDITNYVNTDKADGWYYVSFLDAGLAPQTVWGITAVYENDSMPYSYVKLIHADTTLTNGQEEQFDFNSKFNLKDNFQLSGMILAGGASAWALGDDVTSDKAYAVLSDGTTKQLNETTYKGKKIFEGRSSIDFINDTFDTVRNHNIDGGELDIFNETLSSDFFSGKEMVGYKFVKTGSNTIFPGLLGLTQEIETPEINITTKIEKDNDTLETNDKVTVKTTVTNNKNVCVKSYNNIITTSVDKSLSGIKNVKVYINGQEQKLGYSYDEENGIITIKEIETLNCTDVVIVSYDAVINENIKENNKLNTNATISYSIINLTKLSGEELTRYQSFKITKKATDSLSAEEKLVNPKTGIENYTNIILGIGFVALIAYIAISKKRKLVK